MAEPLSFPRRIRRLFFSDSTTSTSTVFLLRFTISVLLLTFAFLLCSISPPFSSTATDLVLPSNPQVGNTPLKEGHKPLMSVLQEASTKDDKKVIITTLNEAWAAPGSVFDLFLESFRIGSETRSLLSNLVVVALDAKAYQRCLAVHRHCYELVTGGDDFSEETNYMTPDYLKMMWRRIEFLLSVLQMGYSFVFTDIDVMWLRNPFHHFQPDSDFQIACDHFYGDPFDLDNKPNGGFAYVKSTYQSVLFYKYWHSARLRFPGKHDQDVLDLIKRDTFLSEIGLKIKFLDTSYFGGFCEPSKDMNLVCTMHANCCFGMGNKTSDLRLMLQDWKLYLSNRNPSLTWRVPKNCE